MNHSGISVLSRNEENAIKMGTTIKAQLLSHHLGTVKNTRWIVTNWLKAASVKEFFHCFYKVKTTSLFVCRFHFEEDEDEIYIYVDIIFLLNYIT